MKTVKLALAATALLASGGALAQKAGQTRDQATARTELAIIADLYDRGLREPLPIGCNSSAAYATAVRDRQDPVEAARREWESSWDFDREDKRPEHQLAFDGILTLDALLARPAVEDWGTGETTRFGQLSRRLWDRLLVHET